MRRCLPTRRKGMRSSLEELDEIGAGHIEKRRGVHGRQFGILGDEGDPTASGHRFENVHQHGDRTSRQLNGLLLLGIDYPHGQAGPPPAPRDCVMLALPSSPESWTRILGMFDSTSTSPRGAGSPARSAETDPQKCRHRPVPVRMAAYCPGLRTRICPGRSGLPRPRVRLHVEAVSRIASAS